MIEILIYIALFFAALRIMMYFTKNMSGCTGYCNQGRRPCNCKGK